VIPGIFSSTRTSCFHGTAVDVAEKADELAWCHLKETAGRTVDRRGRRIDGIAKLGGIAGLWRRWLYRASDAVERILRVHADPIPAVSGGLPRYRGIPRSDSQNRQLAFIEVHAFF
jgi:hypothetical protein